MVTRTLQAAFKSPELLGSLQLRGFTTSDIILGLQIIALHKPNPPVFYTQFVYSFLGNSAFEFFLKDLEFVSVSAFAKSFIRNYYKFKDLQVMEFEKGEMVELIKSAVQLIGNEKYHESALGVLREACDRLIRCNEFLCTDLSYDVINAMHMKDIEVESAKVLKEMCQANVAKKCEPALSPIDCEKWLKQ